MPNQTGFSFYFKGSDIKKISRTIPTVHGGYFIINFNVNESTGVLYASSQAFVRDKTDRFRIVAQSDIVYGCPVPPCVPQNGKLGKNEKFTRECETETEVRIKKINEILETS